MNTADYVSKQIAILKQRGNPTSEETFEIALLCVYWAYVFGAYGEYCEPSNRRSRYSTEHYTIKTKCKNFNGKDSVPGGCVGCKWFLGTAESDQTKHEGRTRFYDCRGFVYWILHQIYGMWDKCPAGATSMWKNSNNWKDKGEIKNGVPSNVLVCLFYPDKENPNKMAHIGFGYNGRTVECSNGVEYHDSYDKKWTHWAIPKCVPEGGEPVPVTKPTLRKGDSGEWVAVLQTKLVMRGYNIGKSGVDSKFGKDTEAAVKDFQRNNGLVADGICGQKTWDALDKVNDKLYTVTVPHLTKSKADELVKQYVGATMTEEG